MYDRILFPTDGSEGAALALDHVLDIASRHGATIHLLNVAATPRGIVPRIGDDVVEARERGGERIVRDAADRAERKDVTAITEVRQGDPYSEIVDYADTQDVDLVVMPTHGGGLDRFLLGSTTERVVRRATVPVLTLRPSEERRIAYPYRRVLVPTDGSESAEQALSLAVDVAKTDGAALDLLSVVAIESLGADVRSTSRMIAIEDRAYELIADASTYAENAGIESVSGTVEHDASIHRAILSYIDEHDVDIVAVGTHGRTGFDRYVLGSVTEQLVRTSPIPVLTVRGPAEDAP